MAEQKATNITWHDHAVPRADREKLNGHKGLVIWFTGLSACGKSTIANELDYKLYAAGRRTYLLDGDNVRHGLNKNLGFSAEDRAENIRRIGEVAKLFTEAGSIAIWDNRCVLHRATADYACPRTMWRITISGNGPARGPASDRAARSDESLLVSAP